MKTSNLLSRALRLKRRKTRKVNRPRNRHRKKCNQKGQQTTQRRSRRQTISFSTWLACTGRMVDYICGDGNCFFRALSKEVYGTEDYHTEWRQAVCDLIGAHPNVFSQLVDCSTSSESIPSSSRNNNTDTGGVAEHVSNMRLPGTWATSCEIYGAASLLRKEIYVLAPFPCECGEEEYLWLLFYPFSLSSGSQRRSRKRKGKVGTRRRGGRGSGRGTARSSSEMGRREADEGDEDDEESLNPCYVTLCNTNGNHYDRITPAITGICNCQLAPPSLNGVALFMDSVNSRFDELDEEDDERWKEGDEDENKKGNRRVSWYPF